MTEIETPAGDREALNPAAMTERLIDAAVYAETASGPYVSAARKEMNDARAAIEAALTAAPAPAADDVVGCLLAEKPFWFDPATNFVHADDGGGRGTRWEPVPPDAAPAPTSERGEAVAVKPLEWTGDQALRPHSAWYFVNETEGRGWRYSHSSDAPFYPTQAAAKAAAQADYEARILSALAHPPADEIAALRERVRELDKENAGLRATLALTETRENGLRANMDEMASHAHAISKLMQRGALRPDPETGWLEPARARIAGGSADE